MYENPIRIAIDDMAKNIIKAQDDYIVMEIQKIISVDVDKEELIKALKYDREQYEKGYKDGVEATQSRWIPCSERLPEIGENVLIWCKDADLCGENIRIAKLGSHDIEDNHFKKIGEKTVWYTHIYYCDLDDVIAWMPLPEPYRR